MNKTQTKNMSSINERRKTTGRRLTDKYSQIILDNVPVSIITINKKGDVTSANKFFGAFSKEKDFTKINIFKDEFFIRENLVNDYKNLLKDGTRIMKNHCYERNLQGEEKYLKILAIPFRNEKGEIEGAISMASDNTEAVVFKNKLLELNSTLEDKIQHRTEELDKVNKELSKVLELKSIFMADISHEFRTALTIMQCSLELISNSGELKDDNLDLFKNVITEIRRVSAMLTDLSLLTKSDSIVAKDNHLPIDLNDVVSSICKELKVVADEKNITLEFSKINKPVEITANKSDIEKLLLNLIRNAIKYNNNGGWVKVTTERQADGVYLFVEDNGVGIPEKELSYIFERFYRVDRARTRKEGGSGLGLAISKHIVEMHGGKISVQSKEGKGSIFTVFFPHIFGKDKSE